MPRIPLKALLLETTTLNAHSLYILIKQLVEKQIEKIGITIQPAVIYTMINGEQVEVAIPPLAILLENGIQVESLNKAYIITRNTWIEYLHINTIHLLKILEALIKGESIIVNRLHVHVEKTHRVCNNMVYIEPLVIETPYNPPRVNIDLGLIMKFIKELTEDIVVPVICLEDNAVEPIILLQRNENKVIIHVRMYNEDICNVVVQALLDILLYATSRKFI